MNSATTPDNDDQDAAPAPGRHLFASLDPDRNNTPLQRALAQLRTPPAPPATQDS